MTNKTPQSQIRATRNYEARNREKLESTVINEQQGSL